MLSIGDYDRCEAEAAASLSYPQLRAFRPAAFLQTNFPMRVSQEGELVRYADIMHELADFDYHYVRRRYSHREAELMAKIANEVERVTENLSGSPIRPLMNLFPPIEVLRAVTALVSPDAAILEIGPGSGLLGAYLITSGFRYAATDNTQALYLWQNRLFNHLAPDEFAERAVKKRQHARVEHIPWWEFAELFRDPPDLDMIVCDAAMGEMEPFAIWYVIRMAAATLRKSTLGAFIYSNIGEPRFSTLSHVEQIFALAGFHKQTCGDVTVQTLRARTLPNEWPSLGGAAKLRASDFLPIDATRLLDSYDFFAFMGMNKSAAAYEALRQRPKQLS